MVPRAMNQAINNLFLVMKIAKEIEPQLSPNELHGGDNDA